LLFSRSEEFGEGQGLDVLSGVVRRFPAGRKVPHMGWNRVEPGRRLLLFDGIPDGAHFYFVHSYYPEMAVNGVATAWCDYGVRFAAAIERGGTFATQFHPEKSQGWGLRLLENFAALVRATTAARAGPSSRPSASRAAGAGARARGVPTRPRCSPMIRWPWPLAGPVSAPSACT